MANRVQHIKVEKESLPECRHARPATATAVATTTAIAADAAAAGPTAQRGLPVMDAFDIESFFHTLQCGRENRPAGESKEQQQQQDQQQQTACGGAAKKEEVGATESALRLSMIIKQEPPEEEEEEEEEVERELGRPASQNDERLAPEDPQRRQQERSDPQANEMDPREVEELLNYFSGDMTATQLQLSETESSSAAVTPTPRTREEADLLVEMVKTLAANSYHRQLCPATALGLLFPGEGVNRPQEEFSPLSSMDAGSEASSGDEESGVEDGVAGIIKRRSHSARTTSTTTTTTTASGKKREGRGRGDGPSPFSPPPFHSPSSHQPLSFPHPHTPQDVPGMSEEDELYQLDKLLSSMATNTEMRLCGEPQ